MFCSFFLEIIVKFIQNSLYSSHLNIEGIIPDIPSDTEEFLLLHHREHPDGEHHCLAWEQHRRALQRVVRSAQCIIGSTLLCIKYITPGSVRLRLGESSRMNHPDNGLFSLLQLRWHRIHQASTERLRKSFYPQATRILFITYFIIIISSILHLFFNSVFNSILFI